MNPTEFIIEALSFKVGQLIVMSGPDFSNISSILSGTQIVLESSGIPCMVYNAKGTEEFQARLFKSCDAKIHGEDCIWPSSQEGIVWESKVLQANGSMVLLVANEFDPSNKTENIWEFNTSIDSIIDMLSSRNVRNIPFANSFKYTETREIFPFISKIYCCSGQNIELLKNQEQEIPVLEGTPEIHEVSSCSGSITGPAGPSIGKTMVTITGKNFSIGAKVLFGETPGVEVFTINGSSINCITPSHPVGIVDVKITNPDGKNGTLESAFYFY